MDLALLTKLQVDTVAHLADIDAAIAALSPPAILPPLDWISKLPWNDNSPWPFPTRGKDAPVERVKYITIHHSAGHRDTTNITYWNRLHTATKRWPHIGYHFAIAALHSGGEIDLFQCNRVGEFTWHDSRNFDTLALCIAGDLREGHDDEPTPEQVALTARLLAWLIPKLPNFQGVTCHKRIQATACPGDIERWGAAVVTATQELYGLDLEGRWDVTPPRRRFRNILLKQPPADSYEGV